MAWASRHIVSAAAGHLRRCDRREWLGWGFVVAADGYPATPAYCQANRERAQSLSFPSPVRRIHSLNGADNGLHLVSAVAGVAIALWPADRTVPRQGGVADRST
jgi:hypothetical protein